MIYKIHAWNEFIMSFDCLLLIDWYLSQKTETLLLINWIFTGCFLVLAVVFFCLWIRSELKLARHGESVFNKKQKPKK